MGEDALIEHMTKSPAIYKFTVKTYMKYSNSVDDNHDRKNMLIKIILHSFAGLFSNFTLELIKLDPCKLCMNILKQVIH